MKLEGDEVVDKVRIRHSYTFSYLNVNIDVMIECDENIKELVSEQVEEGIKNALNKAEAKLVLS